MTWYSETFYWKPWTQKWDDSIELYIDDGHRIILEMGDCRAKEARECECDISGNSPCGKSYGSANLSIDELRKLHEAAGESNRIL